VLTPLHWLHTVSLVRRVEQCERYGDPALRSVLRRGEVLVVVWIGINDVNDLVKLRGRNATFAPVYEELANAQEKLWDRIYKLGYRDLLLMDLPPLDRGLGTPFVNKTLVDMYNSILHHHAKAFQKRNRDVYFMQFDVNAVLKRVFDDAAAYGFTHTTEFCPGYNQPDVLTDPGRYGCGGGLDTYAWFNSGHLTSRVHGVLAGVLGRWLDGHGQSWVGTFSSIWYLACTVKINISVGGLRI
jgi:phospholipase/lecithinase/hemolysin